MISDRKDVLPPIDKLTGEEEPPPVIKDVEVGGQSADEPATNIEIDRPTKNTSHPKPRKPIMDSGSSGSSRAELEETRVCSSD